jgi:inosine/xanthosine triphosphate pyrophosphatase family protein
MITGWHAAFEYEGKTYGEMTIEERMKVGSRKRVVLKFLAWLQAGAK